MSLIASLTVVQSSRKAVRLNGSNAMRQKLIDRINDQVALAKAQEAGTAYQRIRYRRFRNLESDDIAEVPTKTRVRPWWAEDKDGSVLLWIKYGNQPLELQKGKTAIRLSSRGEVISALEVVKAAVREGEFDQKLTDAADAFRARFKR